jgi:potassium/hydrogen antiporter
MVGFVGGYTAVEIVNRVELGATGMYPVLVSAWTLLTFGVAVQIGGSGFLAVYLAGVVIGNRRLMFQRSIRRFHDAIAWLAQITMFVALGLLCFPSRLLDVSGKALLVSVVIMFIARPVAVFLSAGAFRFSWRELTFLSWVGLKGAVPITLATFPLMLGTAEFPLQATLLFDVVFFIVVVSAVIQGTSLTPVARWLGLERPRDPEPPVSLEISSLRQMDGEVVDYAIGDDSRAAGRLVKDLALPGGVVIALVARGDQIIPPQGLTRIQAGDHVILVLRAGTQPLVNQVFGRDTEERGTVPKAIEFPFRGWTTVGELEEFYSIHIDVPPQTTLDEVMRRELGPEGTTVDAAVEFGSLRFRIQRLSSDGVIELVGMSILPETENLPR